EPRIELQDTARILVGERSDGEMFYAAIKNWVSMKFPPPISGKKFDNSPGRIANPSPRESQELFEACLPDEKGRLWEQYNEAEARSRLDDFLGLEVCPECGETKPAENAGAAPGV